MGKIQRTMVMRTKTQKERIMALLTKKSYKGMLTREIASFLKADFNSIATSMWQMKKSGFIKQEYNYRFWSYTPKGFKFYNGKIKRKGSST